MPLILRTGLPSRLHLSIVFFFADTSTTQTDTLSLHDALPISRRARSRAARQLRAVPRRSPAQGHVQPTDRKSTRLNSSHRCISYAVFCLKKKNIHVHIEHFAVRIMRFLRAESD